MVGAIVYPNLDLARARLKERGEPPSEASVKKLVQDELDALCKELAPYKRVTDVILTDAPLPKTAILKVARGQLPAAYTFDLKRWEETWRDQPSLIPAAPAEGGEPAEND
jgi:hypothetical protein